MRLTKHNGRKNKAGVYRVKHNDRNFDLDKAKHIDKEKTKDNVYWHVYENENLTFEQAELKFYKENFSAMLDAKNQRYIKQRHPERVKTMEQMIKNEKFCPEETLYYIGKKGDTVDKDTLISVFDDYKKWHEKEYPNIKILDWSFHGDEPNGAPHIQERHVWTFTDKEGNLSIGQNKALAEMNIQAPEPDKPIDKNNNAKMTYTADTRKKLFDICKEHGLELIEEPQEASRSGLSQLEYIRRQELEKLEKQREELKNIKAETDKYANKIELTRHDEESLNDVKNQVEHKTKTLSRKNYVEISEENYNRLISICENGINSNLANLNLHDENLKLKRENKKLNAALSDERKRAFAELGGENAKLKEKNSKLTKENNTLKSKTRELGQVQKQAIFLMNFMQDKGETKEFKDWYQGLPNNVKEASPDALDGALKDWAHMSQARREDEMKKQEAKLI